MAYMSMSLHAVNHRLTNVPVKQLPHLASCLASSISNCGELLSTPQSQKSGKTDSDNAVQVHKLITRLGSLLQDRTYEGRWTAVVLVKALVEAGQWEILRSSEPFVRGLISILAVRCSIEDNTAWQMLTELLRIEIGPRFHEENVHYHLNSHLPPDLPVSDPRSRDHHSVSARLHYLCLESDLRQAIF